jgi:hypothetical protein
MWTPHISFPISEESEKFLPSRHFYAYGLGWFLQDLNGRKLVRHGGGTNGFVTHTLMVPEEKLGVVVLTNTDANDLYSALCYQVVESYLNMPYRNLSSKAFERFKANHARDERVVDSLQGIAGKAPNTTLPMASYGGTYRNEFYGDVTVMQNGNALSIAFPPHRVTGTAQPLGGNEFLCTYSDKTWGIQKLTFTAEGKAVKTMTVKVNDFIDYLPYEFVKTK